MTSRGELPIGEGRCALLRDRAIVSIEPLVQAVHYRNRGAGGELISHLAYTAEHARNVARHLIDGADRVDPAGASLVLIDVTRLDAAQRARLRELLSQPPGLEVVK